MASRMAERWYTRLSQLLNHQLSARQPLILYASAPHFRQTNVIEGELGEGTGGVTEAFKRRIVLPFAGPIGDTTTCSATSSCTRSSTTSRDQRQLGSRRRAGAAAVVHRGHGGVPVARPGRSADGDVDARGDAARAAADVDKLDNPKYFPYRYGQALWAYIGGKYGDDAVGNMLRAAAGRDATYEHGHRGGAADRLPRQLTPTGTTPSSRRSGRSPSRRRCRRRSRARSSQHKRRAAT